MLLVLHLVLNRLLYFYRLILFNEAIKHLELFLFKVNSLLVPVYSLLHHLSRHSSIFLCNCCSQQRSEHTQILISWWNPILITGVLTRSCAITERVIFCHYNVVALSMLDEFAFMMRTKVQIIFFNFQVLVIFSAKCCNFNVVFVLSCIS